MKAKDAKPALEQLLKKVEEVPQFRLVEENQTVKAGRHKFQVEVSIGERSWLGCGKTLKRAEEIAAQKALVALGQVPLQKNILLRQGAEDHSKPVSQPLRHNFSTAPLVVVDTVEILHLWGKHFCSNVASYAVVALDLEGVPEEISFIQLQTSEQTIVFDAFVLGINETCQVLKPLLESPECLKLMQDLRRDAQALSQLAQIDICGVLDVQLLAECMTGNLFSGFNAVLQLFHVPESHSSKLTIHRKLNAGEQLFKQRPIPQEILEYVADDVRLLRKCWTEIQSAVPLATILAARSASQLRAKNASSHQGLRLVWFNSQSLLTSSELLTDLDVPAQQVEVNFQALLNLIPERFRIQPVLCNSLSQLVDVMLDKGRVPHGYYLGRKRFVLEGGLVTCSDLDELIQLVGGETRFGSDNRAGLEGELHRISAMRNNQRGIYGVTLRVGRAVQGLSCILKDVLLSQELRMCSVLFLGIPGSGKTTMIRDVARVLSEDSEENVCIVDTSNEIGGDSDVPHRCLGFARRMMVPSLSEQASVMIECLQNHTVGTMVIDEIGRKSEVAAARTVRQRGVRLIASAHGDFRTLLKNKELNGLLGGVESVTLGDFAAAKSTFKSKLKAERGGEPTFDIVVELGVEGAVRIVFDVADAVDRILNGEKVHAQIRRRVSSGLISLELGEI